MGAKHVPRSIRTETWIRQRPWLSMATVASVIGVLTAVMPAVIFIKGYFQTADDARAESIANKRRDAWAAYGIADLRRVLARNRVWECDAKKQKSASDPMVLAEVVACNQYQRDFEEANVRANKLFDKAMAYGEDR